MLPVLCVEPRVDHVGARQDACQRAVLVDDDQRADAVLGHLTGGVL
jgi:hypothetical protein